MRYAGCVRGTGLMIKRNIKQKDVIATRGLNTGAWNLSVIVANVEGGYLHRSYFGYTKREALRLFTNAVNSGEIN